MELDPKLKPLVDSILELTPLPETSVEDARLRTAGIAELVGDGPELESVTDVEIPTDGESVSARVYVPPGGSVGVLVYFHGGGWVIGEVAHYDALTRQLALQSGCTVISVDYRRAPEDIFPAAVDDAYAATAWAATEYAADLPLGVVGDSAGGNLAAVICHLAKQRGGPELAIQVLMYPVLDCDLDTDSYLEQASGGLLNRADMVWFWEQYVPAEEGRSDPMASPLRYDDVEDLPSAVIGLPWFDPLRSEGEAYAERLAAAGNQVSVLRYPDQAHGFLNFAQFLPAADLALGQVSGLVRAQFLVSATAETEKRSA